MVEHSLSKREVIGSIPVGGSLFYLFQSIKFVHQILKATFSLIIFFFILQVNGIFEINNDDNKYITKLFDRLFKLVL